MRILALIISIASALYVMYTMPAPTTAGVEVGDCYPMSRELDVVDKITYIGNKRCSSVTTITGLPYYYRPGKDLECNYYLTLPKVACPDKPVRTIE